ncbi:hypothetical protein BC629DRAFT_1258254, partial [Irpex lacteus]
MNAFIATLLGYSKDSYRSITEGGVLGHVKSYFGCVEAQGRGSLHCHMVVWLHGALNPDEINLRLASGDTDFAGRLFSFLDDTISNEIPAAPSDSPEGNRFASGNPCRHRGVPADLPEDVHDIARQWDLHRLATACQLHVHKATCFKYCKPGEPKVCRFDLDPSNVVKCTSYNQETGELCLRCLDGMVNNFNRTILEAMRCNMDIKFIGSGEGAKAITYYITNYITKAQLKTHVAYAALELAVRRLGSFDADSVLLDPNRPYEDSYMVYAKQMLRRCAYAILTHQELSAQQVASYLMGFDDRYASDTFANLYWPSFERYVNKLLPSPECAAHDDLLPQSTHDEDSESNNDPSVVDDSASESSDSTEHHIDNDMNEVIITSDSDGKLVASSNQLCDYLYRGENFGDLCV